jgi:hypothetical protein
MDWEQRAQFVESALCLVGTSREDAERAAVHLQRVQRGQKARSQVQLMKADKRQREVAAVNLQRAQRGKVARRRVQHMKAERRQHESEVQAAIALQSVQRGRAGRKKAKNKKDLLRQQKEESADVLLESADADRQPERSKSKRSNRMSAQMYANEVESKLLAQQESETTVVCTEHLSASPEPAQQESEASVVSMEHLRASPELLKRVGDALDDRISDETLKDLLVETLFAPLSDEEAAVQVLRQSVVDALGDRVHDENLIDVLMERLCAPPPSDEEAATIYRNKMQDLRQRMVDALEDKTTDGTLVSNQGSEMQVGAPPLEGPSKLYEQDAEAEKRHNESEVQAAITLQSVHRGRAGRKKAKNQRDLLSQQKEDSADVLLECTDADRKPTNSRSSKSANRMSAQMYANEVETKLLAQQEEMAAAASRSSHRNSAQLYAEDIQAMLEISLGLNSL